VSIDLSFLGSMKTKESTTPMPNPASSAPGSTSRSLCFEKGYLKQPIALPFSLPGQGPLHLRAARHPADCISPQELMRCAGTGLVVPALQPDGYR